MQYLLKPIHRTKKLKNYMYLNPVLYFKENKKPDMNVLRKSS